MSINRANIIGHAFDSIMAGLYVGGRAILSDARRRIILTEATDGMEDKIIAI